MAKDFLLEIGCEEMPPKALPILVRALTKHIGTRLDQHQLQHGEIQMYSTPRRLAVIVCDLIDKQPDRHIERKGPTLEKAFDKNGKPTRACSGFAKSCGVGVNDLQQHETEKGTWLVYRYKKTGDDTSAILPDLIRDAISNLPIPKLMRWGDHATRFIRPVHWVIMLYGKHVIETTILGVKTSDKTFGHRFHHPGSLTIKHERDYPQVLFKHGTVMADFALRRTQITNQIKTIEVDLPSANVLVDDELLKEVTALVEWPNALLCRFDDRFLTVPKEALIASMQSHQKCFPIVNQNNPDQLLPYFITVSNINSLDEANVIEGNERVMRARLSDAKFFFDQDSQHSLASYLPDLEHVVYQQQLGNLRDKVQRISQLAKQMAMVLNHDPTLAERAGLLCKTDLKTQMVGEFPELQGVMGYYYALQHGEVSDIAVAIEEHYKPRFADDDLPKSDLGSLVSISDKIDTLIGIFGINQQPTGDKDPFALRRAALGIIRILLEKQYDVDLKTVFMTALEQYQVTLSNQQVLDDCLRFVMERFRRDYLEHGGKADIFAAVAACDITIITDFKARLLAVEAFYQLPESANLAKANKRVHNVLKKSVPSASSTDSGHFANVKFRNDDQVVKQNNVSVNSNLLIEPQEKALAAAIDENTKTIAPLLNEKRYTEVLSTLAQLQPIVDDFFDQVLVMTDDLNVQQNRLALLHQLRNLFLHVADVSLLQAPES